jgi:restriction system protein
MPVPDVQSFMLPVLSIISEGETDSEDLRRRIANEFHLTDADLREMLSGGVQSVFTNRVSWAIVSLQNSGLIEKVGRKRYRATSAGLQLLSEDPERIKFRASARPIRAVDRQPRSSEDGPLVTFGSDGGMPPSITPEEQIERSYESLSSALAAGLLERIREMPPRLFENLTVELLIKLGYGGGDLARGQAVGRSGDGGIDGVIKEDALGLDRIYVQAKRYAAGNTVGRPEVQSFAGSLDLHHATKGIFITTSSFSPGAHDFVTKIAKQIILVEGLELAKMLVERGVGVRIVKIYEIKSVDENYFEELSLS